MNDIDEPERCWTCGAHDPRLHPATQFEGEVAYICPDPFHNTVPGERLELDQVQPVGERATLHTIDVVDVPR